MWTNNALLLINLSIHNNLNYLLRWLILPDFCSLSLEISELSHSLSLCRVLIAYASGFLILWDVVEAQIVVSRGDKVLHLKDGVVDSPGEGHTDLPGDASEEYLEDKEISALCWASSSGSILAVGYIDGDILFWKTSGAAASKKGKRPEISANIVRLQLSSAESRLPVIVLHWSANSKSHSDCDGQLFIYGGCEIGSEEVVTVSHQIGSRHSIHACCTSPVLIVLRSTIHGILWSDIFYIVVWTLLKGGDFFLWACSVIDDLEGSSFCTSFSRVRLMVTLFVYYRY